MGLLNGILTGLGWIWSQTASHAANTLWNQIVGGLVSWVLDSIAWFVDAVLAFFQRTSTPDLASGWFAGAPAGAGAHSPYGVVVSLALSLLLLCVLLSVLHGLVLGEGPAMAARLARDVPLAVLGMVATIGVVQVLLGAADQLSAQILSSTDAGAHATDVLRTLSTATAFNGQPTFVVFLLGLVAVLGAFLLWVELLVRASLLYVLIALSPLAYAAFVWPTARRVLHRLAELVVALVLSKVVIAITLAVAASALASSPSTTTIPGDEAKLGTLLVGTIMFLLAAFAPFLILRLFPLVEAATVARGVSRAPARATQTALLTTLTVTRLAGVAGGQSAGSGGARAAATVSGSPRALTAPPPGAAAARSRPRRPSPPRVDAPPGATVERDRPHPPPGPDSRSEAW
jgi:large-conductance mechanosensitive channel